jgi:hypothetical protein
VRKLLVVLETKIFASAFPWLFPGGQGDIKDASGEFVRLGNKDVILQGCRFIKDPVYTFFSTTTSPGMNSNIWKVVL